ncbi:MAG TPA: PilZ domain-containing protein [Terriglobales bacterium]|nr:PilZ domain-containing protein [Terriglobales bacterium]
MAQVLDNDFPSPLAPIPPARKASARTALVDLHEPARTILSECFKQFGIDTVAVTANAAERFKKEKFEACVVKLGPAAEPIMEAARTSASNARMVIYGLGGSAQDAMKFSRYGINAVFCEPVDRSTALKLVRATQMLVLHEFRRYVRVPVITSVAVTDKQGKRLNATSKELSSGGMSMSTTEELSVGTSLEVSFALLTLPRISIKGTVCWRAKNSFGVRFDPLDEQRARLKDWVQAYLEN